MFCQQVLNIPYLVRVTIPDLYVDVINLLFFNCAR